MRTHRTLLILGMLTLATLVALAFVGTSDRPADAAGRTIHVMDSGVDHACATRTDGGVKCRNSSRYGEPGDGTSGTHLRASALALSAADVSGLAGGFTPMAAGAYRTCVPTTTTAVECWGDSSFGALRDGRRTAMLVLPRSGPAAAEDGGAAEPTREAVAGHSKGSGLINGTVTDDDTGAPLSDICVDVTDASFSFFGFALTAADGSYSVGGLATGDYTVGFFDCGDAPTYLREWYDDKPDFDSADLVAVTDETKTSGIDAALTVGGSINGTVTDEDTGAPISDICVGVTGASSGSGGFGFALTAADGSYSVDGLATGDYTVGFFDCGDAPTYLREWYDDRPDFDSADLVAVIAESKTSGIDAALAVGGSINGTVTDEDTGAPISDICVDVTGASSGSGGFGFALTAADGSYSVGALAAGDYTVGFFDCGDATTYLREWYDDKPDFDSADPVAVIAESKTPGIDAALAVGASINGTVTDLATGAPLADVCVDVWDASSNFVSFGFTDAGGSYSAGGLPPGDYKVGFFDCGGGSTYLTEWYDDKPDFDSADPVTVIGDSKTSGINAALAQSALFGDVSCDGIVDAVDPLLILQLVAGFVQSLACESAADVDLNGLIDPVDALIILQFIAGLVGSLPP